MAPRAYRELASHDFPAMLHSFPGPALILNGENDKPNRKREAALLNATQDGQLEIITQANDVCDLDQPEAFTHQVRTFAKRLKTATSNESWSYSGRRLSLKPILLDA